MDSKYLSENEIECIKNIFDKYDINHNGLLEKEEFDKCFPKLLELMGDQKSAEETKTIAEEGIEKFDFDHDGALECKEFTELMSFLILEKGLSFDYRYRYNMMI